MNKKILENIISNGESSTTEFKTTFNTKVIESIVAFSNAYGGNIVIGLNDNSEIVGVDITSETIQNWQNEVKQKTEPAIVPRIEVVELQSKNVVVIIVPEFPIKPVSTKGRYFVRKNNSNHRLTTDEIIELRMLSMNTSFDAFEVDINYDHLDKEAVQVFIDKIKDRGRFELTKDILLDFEKLGFTNKGKFTRASELLFGNHHTSIHIGRFKSKSTIIDDVVIRSPLVLAVDEAMTFIKKNILLSYKFTGKLQREERWQYSLQAIR